MNWQTFISNIQKESDNILFISSARQEKKIGMSISAFLNTNGGNILIGYDKINVHLTGYDQEDQWIDFFIEEHFRKSDITFSFLFRSNKKILIIDIKKSETPCPFNSIFYKFEEKNIVTFVPPAIKTTRSTQAPKPLIPQENPTIFQSSIDEISDLQNKQPVTRPIQETINKAPIPTPIINKDSEPSQQNNMLSSLSDQKDNSSQFAPPPTFDPPTVHHHQSKEPQTPPQNDIKIKPLNKRQLGALSYVNKKGTIKNKIYRKLFDVSHKTAHIELTELLHQKKVVVSGSGRSTCYVLPKTNNLQQEENKDIISAEQSMTNSITATTSSHVPSSTTSDFELFISKHGIVTEAMYADEFNIQLAQAIEDLQYYCDKGTLQKTTHNSENCFIKPIQVS